MSQQLFYLAMAGLDATMDRVTAAANNLANRGTTAFKAQNPGFQALPMYGQGLPDREGVHRRQLPVALLPSSCV